MSYSGELRRQITFAVLKQGEAVSHVAQKYNVARKTIYFWIKRYQQAPLRNKTKALESRYVSGKNHPRAQAHRARPTLIRLVVLHPDWGCRKLSLALKKKGIDIGYFGVNRLLTRLEAGTLEQRQNFSRNYSGPGRLKADIKLEVIRKVLEERKSISKLASEYAVARKSIHQWLARYQEAKERGISGAVALKESYVTAQKHPRAIYPKITAELLSLIAQNPELSVHKLAKLVPASSWTVWSILNRNNLNLYQQRVAFAQSQRQVQVPVFSWLLDRIRLVWETFVPSVAPAPPPFAAGQAPQRMYRMVRPFLLSLVTSSLFSLGFIWWINLLASQPFGTSIGLLFATVALFFGSFFFAYSMKYYFTLAIVLSFSQQSGANGSPQLVNGKRRNLLSWILGLNGNGSVKQNGRLLPAGLEPSLEHITLKRKPFISVHIPFYNEKNVAERILAAVTAFDWANYEVIVVDDSTDETTGIAKQFLKVNYGELRIIKDDEGTEIYKTPIINPNNPSSTLKNLPTITIIHRTTRSGFKGGALAEALKHTDPRAEFVVVFDADFVPYPDTLELFLKYFQVTAGSLDFKKVTSDQWLVTSEGKQNKPTNHQPPITNHSSNIAAVQGYQWHVLNKSENWITRGVRSEYSGSYVIERSGQEILGALKMISGSVYMIRKDVLDEIGWETSITEDFELTLKLYEKGYKVVYTPYIQAPAECVSTIKRLVRQRMRWAEGHSHNVRKMFVRLLLGSWKTDDGGQKTETEDRKQMTENQPSVIGLQNPSSAFSFQSSRSQSSRTWVSSPLTLMEKLEFLYLSPYYLQAFLFLVGTISWLISETVFAARLPFWTSLWGWSLVLTNFLALPLLNGVGLFLEEAEERDFVGLLSFIALSYIVVPFQAYAAVKGFLEKEEGPWFRTPKTGRITDIFTRGRFYRLIAGILPGRATPAIARMQANSASGLKLMEANSPYLGLATANSRFDSFKIKKKRISWVGKIALVSVLTLSLFVNSMALHVKPVEATWYADANYLYRKVLTIDETLVSGSADHSNFPILVSYTDASLKTTANGGRVTNSSGFDIIFTDDNKTTKLDHEIERYTATTGEIFMWVRIPTLPYNVDKDIYIYYGNSSISTSQENVAGVWDANYKGVWHLKENPAGTAPQMKDSTSNANNGTSAGAMTSGDQVAGQVDGSLDFDGTDDYVDFGTPLSLRVTSNLTFSAWVKIPATTIRQAIMDRSVDVAFMIEDTTSRLRVFAKPAGGSGAEALHCTAGTAIDNNVFHHVVLTYDTSIWRAYADGVQDCTGTGVTGTLSDTSGYITTIGFYIGSNSFAIGLIDEARISNVVRSAGWITTEYNNQNNQGTGTGKFIKTLGSEEQVPEMIVLLLPLAILIPYFVKSMERRKKMYLGIRG